MNNVRQKAHIVATVKSCEQYRFRVDLPAELERSLRDSIRKKAVSKVNSKFLKCTEKYQSLAWVGVANLSFIDSRSSPSDSKSDFLHSLICLQIVTLSCEHYRKIDPDQHLVLNVTAGLSFASRKLIRDLCVRLNIKMRYEPEEGNSKPIARPRIASAYRAATQGANTFSNQPIKSVEDFRTAIMRRLTGKVVLKKVARCSLDSFIMLLWPIPIIARLLFSMAYRFLAKRILMRLDSDRNVFAYFDLRLGRNRSVPAYFRWKFGSALDEEQAQGASVIPFSHLARTGHAYSFVAMLWSMKSLLQMYREPKSGCIVVNYLISPVLLYKIQVRRNKQRRVKRSRLLMLQKQSADYVEQVVYSEFIALLDGTKAFSIELARSYQDFFEMMRPGVVLQADAVAKTARHFTTSARARGGKVIYIADRICTDLRTSNQLISDKSRNLQHPDRFVVFDQVSRNEFMRQGVASDRIYTYHRSYNLAHTNRVVASPPGLVQVVIFLQAYEDNIGAMVRLGVDLIRAMQEIKVVYQEHPNFPVNDHLKLKLIKESTGRIYFLERSESADYDHALAMVTGYSTAVVPGILHGVPLIWLRRQIDNSIYGESYLDPIGFAADSTKDVVTILRRLLSKDEVFIEDCEKARNSAKMIFTPPTGSRGLSLEEVLGKAIGEAYGEIAVELNPGIQEAIQLLPADCA